MSSESKQRIVKVRENSDAVLKRRRPFWLPAPNYYFLAAAVAIGFFFLVWGILHDGRDETPWITAGLVSSCILIGAVILREMILRNARERFLRDQRRLDKTLRSVAFLSKAEPPEEKLTLERNAVILSEIRRKSDAAKVLGKLSESHKEVFVLCAEYIALVERELPLVGAGSPRIAALRQGKHSVSDLHRYHMLQWAEIEARHLGKAASDGSKNATRLGAAKKAHGVVLSALRSYPLEQDLVQSELVLADLIVSIKVSALIEKAERAAYKGNRVRAVSQYQDALFYLEREGSKCIENEELGSRLSLEIEKLRHFDGEAEA